MQATLDAKPHTMAASVPRNLHQAAQLSPRSSTGSTIALRPSTPEAALGPPAHAATTAGISFKRLLDISWGSSQSSVTAASPQPVLDLESGIAAPPHAHHTAYSVISNSHKQASRKPASSSGSLHQVLLDQVDTSLPPSGHMLPTHWGNAAQAKSCRRPWNRFSGSTATTYVLAMLALITLGALGLQLHSLHQVHVRVQKLGAQLGDARRQLQQMNKDSAYVTDALVKLRQDKVVLADKLQTLKANAEQGILSTDLAEAKQLADSAKEAEQQAEHKLREKIGGIQENVHTGLSTERQRAEQASQTLAQHQGELKQLQQTLQQLQAKVQEVTANRESMTQQLASAQQSAKMAAQEASRMVSNLGGLSGGGRKMLAV